MLQTEFTCPQLSGTVNGGCTVFQVLLCKCLMSGTQTLSFIKNTYVLEANVEVRIGIR